MAEHAWRFVRSGGFDQVRIEDAEDLRSLPDLSQKLWVALACPVKGLHLDPRTAAFVDSDGDGRIRAPEVLDAVRWMCEVLGSPESMLRRDPELRLEDISTETDEGKAVLASARQVLDDLDKPHATAITPDDTADTAAVFARTRFNGDGVVPVEAADDEATAAALKDVLACVGSETDRSGKPGVTAPLVAQLFEEAEAFAAHWADAEADPTILACGAATPAAWEALGAVREKVDDFFARCHLAAFDPRALSHLARQPEDWAAIAARPIAAEDEAVAAFPLAAIAPGAELPFGAGLNPAWAGRVARFRREVVTPLLGQRETLAEADWSALKERMAPYGEWSGRKKGGKAEPLGIARVKELLASSSRGDIEALIAKDEELRPRAEAIQKVDKAVLLHRDIGVLLENFVSFLHFYGRREAATFQVGTLYLDGRSCELCVAVDDVTKHAALAASSQAFIAYCECTRKGSTEKKTIAALFTDGDSDFLTVGRNGIFYDRDGKDWDATVLRLVEAPISVRQAFWSPYKRVAALVREQVERFAATRSQAVSDRAAAQVTEASSRAQAAPTAAPAPAAGAATAPGAPAAFDIARFAGIFAAIGLALGAIATALAAVITGFLGLRLWQMPLAIIGALLLVSGPSMLMAWLKLRRRNLAPILDASGWAVNARARITVAFGKSLTRIATLPKGSSRSMNDPYAPSRAWVYWLVLLTSVAVALVALWSTGTLQGWVGLD